MTGGPELREGLTALLSNLTASEWAAWYGAIVSTVIAVTGGVVFWRRKRVRVHLRFARLSIFAAAIGDRRIDVDTLRVYVHNPTDVPAHVITYAFGSVGSAMPTSWTEADKVVAAHGQEYFDAAASEHPDLEDGRVVAWVELPDRTFRSTRPRKHALGRSAPWDGWRM